MNAKGTTVITRGAFGTLFFTLLLAGFLAVFKLTVAGHWDAWLRKGEWALRGVCVTSMFTGLMAGLCLLSGVYQPYYCTVPQRLGGGRDSCGL